MTSYYYQLNFGHHKVLSKKNKLSEPQETRFHLSEKVGHKYSGGDKDSKELWK